MRIRILIALALVGALAGCQESGFDESKETQRPLKVQDAMNPLTGTKVPGQAERPATLEGDTFGDTVALGVKPVVAVLPGRTPRYLREASQGMNVVRETDLAAIERARPDVILGSKDLNEDDYPDLMKIAPTILDEGDDWKLNLRLHGEALGRTNEAEGLLTDYDNRVARVERMLGDRKTMIRITSAPDTGEIPLDPETPGGSSLADLGVKPYDYPSRGYRVIDLTVGPEWYDGGILGARARLADIAKVL